MEVAYETAVLGVLRQGFRCFHLRSMKGVRIELCTLLVHIEIGEESNFLGDRRELVQTMLEQQATISQQRQELVEKEHELRGRDEHIRQLSAALEAARSGKTSEFDKQGEVVAGEMHPLLDRETPVDLPSVVR